MTYKTIRVSSVNRVTTITINRPDARNSLTAETIHELIHAFTQIASDDHTRSVLLTGEGTESFCAGADIKALQDNATPDARREFFESVANLIQAIRRCPAPVVAAVHGFAVAGGCGLAAASDICIAADDAVFGLPEVGIGLAPMVVMAPISRSINNKGLALLALTGERINASRALAIGLISEVVPKATLMERAMEVCQTISKQGPHAVRATKAALLDLTERDFDSVIHELADTSALVSLGAEATEGIKAFSEKRPPAWKK